MGYADIIHTLILDRMAVPCSELPHLRCPKPHSLIPSPRMGNGWHWALPLRFAPLLPIRQPVSLRSAFGAIHDLPVVGDRDHPVKTERAAHHVRGDSFESGGVAGIECDTLIHAETGVLPQAHLLDDFRANDIRRPLSTETAELRRSDMLDGSSPETTASLSDLFKRFVVEFEELLDFGDPASLDEADMRRVMVVGLVVLLRREFH